MVYILNLALSCVAEGVLYLVNRFSESEEIVGNKSWI